MLFNEEYKHEILRFLQKKGRNEKGGSVQDGRERGKRKTVFLEVCPGWEQTLDHSVYFLHISLSLTI